LSSNRPIIGFINDFKKVMRDHIVDEVFILKPLRTIPKIDRFIYKAESMGISVHLLPEGVMGSGLRYWR